MGLNETISKIYGNSVSVVKKTPVSGGDINRAYALALSDGSRLFMKANSVGNADFFRAEAEGLEAIRKTGAINVPRVIAAGEDSRESFLLLEYIDEGRHNRFASYASYGRGDRASMLDDINRDPSEELGHQLAAMHKADTCRFVWVDRSAAGLADYVGNKSAAGARSEDGACSGASDADVAGARSEDGARSGASSAGDTRARSGASDAGAADNVRANGERRAFVIGFHKEKKYGFLHDNYIGAGYQDNTPEDTWKAFFINRRLRPQFDRAASYWSSEDRKKIDLFLERVDRYLDEPEQPSLIHGDLWGGNYMIDSERRPWLIDPAAYVGHAEADLAMTELFGGFDRRFYDAYKEAAGIDSGYRDRRDLYNLYHLLNHLNLFGGGYMYSVKSIVQRYTA